ncbi:MAG: pyridoxal phosphate-dependent aminotransferase [Betaproteobacteria bacterium]|nr:pyridoxal phosphate-dependent aminotransferase [Betaproteobacteria bacterium]
MGFFARRLEGIAPSPIAVLSQKARQLKAKGVDVIDLGVGEPDFDTPEFIKQAVVSALGRGETKYTATNGSIALRQAICDKFARENELRYTLDQIAVSGGAKQIIFNAMMATLDPGDEVIVPAPFWASYPEIVRIAGGVPAFVPCSEANGFTLTPEDLAAAIGPRTKWLFLNSPGNPSGAAYDVDQLRALAAVLLDRPQVWVMSDDIYEHLLFDGRRFTNIAQVEPRLFERTLTLNGVSKTYAMTGWRLGYAGAPDAMIRAMSNVQTQSTTHASSLSQAGALAALTGPQDFLADRVASFRERRDLMVQRLNGIAGLNCRRPEGAFYVFPSCAGLLDRRRPDGERLKSDQDLALYLLEAAQVSLVPGTLFGTPNYLRLSTAADIGLLRAACDRIEAACSRLH